MKIRSLMILMALVLALGCARQEEAKEEQKPATGEQTDTVQTEKEQKKIVVNFWHSMAGKHKDTIDGYVTEFQKLHPEIEVKAIYQGAYAQLNQKLIAAITSRQVPTMAQQYESWTTRFYRRDLLEPVQSFIDGADGMSQEDFQDIVKEFRANCSYDGKMVSMPFNKSSYVLFVNMKMLKEAGYTQPPQTWQELREMAKKTTKKEPGKPPVYGFGTRPFIESFTTFLFIADGDYVNEKGEIAVNTEIARKSLQIQTDLILKDKAAYVESDYLSTPFGSERVALFVGSSAGYPYVEKAVMDKFEWTVAPIPKPEEVKGKVLFQGTNIGIFKEVPKEEKRAGWLFLRFMLNRENALKWALQTGYLPVRYSVIESPEMKESFQQNPRFKIIVEQIDRAAFEPREPYWETMRLEIGDEIDAILNGRRTVEQGLESAQKKCEQVLEISRK